VNEAEQKREKTELDTALAVFGLVAEVPQDEYDEIFLWPCNLESWRLFMRLQSQWTVGVAGATGLNYSGVESALRLMGIKGQKRSELFSDIQVMEEATLEAWEQRRNKESGG
jgi:hypothetical protein